MKVLVVGASGRIGSKIVAQLIAAGHEALPGSRSNGVDSFSGLGLLEAVTGVHAVVDASDAPGAGTENTMRNFFTVSTANLLAAERSAGVDHHVALSVVGADRVPGSAYYRAKVAQEHVIASSGQPYTIVRATQFFEFAVAIADSVTRGGQTRLPPAATQPIAACDVATAVTYTIVMGPINGVLSVAGPARMSMDDFVRAGLTAAGDRRTVITDSRARYFGALLDDDSLVPAAGEDAIEFPTTLETWTATHQHPGSA